MKKLLRDKEIIQIDVTNACVNACSNCTRFVGHHKKHFFMDFSTYKTAVNSLDGFSGIIGMIGGEPLLHKNFEQMALYIKEINIDKSKKGLWTCLPLTKYNTIINDVFGALYLNDHSDSRVLHAPMLTACRELISDPKALWDTIESCWLYETWSPTITPKGAFFCEVAGALDMLFDGPGGWPIEKGWWERTPADYGEQKTRWCPLCGGALTLRRRASGQGIDDVTPGNLDLLRKVGSRRVDVGAVEIWDIKNPTSGYWTPSANHYMDELPVHLEAEYRGNIRARLIAGDDSRILVIDPGMIIRSGHHFSMNLAFQEIFRYHDIKASFFITSHSRDFKTFSHFDRIFPVLNFDYYAPTKAPRYERFEEALYQLGLMHILTAAGLKWSLFKRRRNCQKRNHKYLIHRATEFLDCLVERLAQIIDKGRLIFSHTCNAETLLGYALWFTRLADAVKPRLALCVHSFDTASRFDMTAFRLAMAMFAGDKRVRIFASSPIVAEKINAYIRGAKVQWLPFPLFPHEGESLPRNAPDEVTFGFVGEARDDKKVSILAPAIERYLAAGGRGRFMISLAKNGESGEIVDSIEQLSSLADKYRERVFFSCEPIVGEEYLAILSQFDALILVNKPEVYTGRSSKVFAEATAYGIPVICPAGTDQARECDMFSYPHFTMKKLSVDDLTDALNFFEAEAATYYEKRNKFKSAFSAFHTAENVLNILLEAPQALLQPKL